MEPVRSFVSSCLGWVDRHAIGVAIGACASVVLIGSVLIVSIARLNHTPRWWTQVEEISTDRASVVEQAETLENAITTQLTALRDEDDPRWRVAINPEQANAWLEARLIDTITTHLGNQAWPSEVRAVRVGVLNDRLIVGAKISHASGSMILWAIVELSLDEHGSLWALMPSVHVGQTRVPRWMLGLVERQMIERSRIEIGPGELELGDGRVAKLIGLRVNDGRLELVMETRAIE